MTTTSGIIFVHCVSAALKPHVQWTCESALEEKLNIRWKPQPTREGTWCANIPWKGPAGTSTKVSSALYKLQNLWFEVTEHGTASTDSSWLMHTPSLGLFHIHTDRAGNFVLTEEHIKRAYEVAGNNPERLYQQFSLALGEAWDAELEPLRAAHDLSSVTVIPHFR